jgi:septal ring factor EnvC (AmiA/AmiB activator)
MPKKIRTHRERAEERLGVAQRAVNKLSDTVDRLEKEVADARAALVEAQARLDHAEADPALTETLPETVES